MTREQIISKAMHLFIKHGYHGLSTRMIAQETGISVGTIYHHFKDKKELFYTVLSETTQKDPIFHTDIQTLDELFDVLLENRDFYLNLDRLIIETPNIYGDSTKMMADTKFQETVLFLKQKYTERISKIVTSTYPNIEKKTADDVALMIFQLINGQFFYSMLITGIDLEKNLRLSQKMVKYFLEKFNEEKAP